MVEAAAGFDILNLLLVLVVAWICGAIAERLSYPAMMGELVAGFVFGPPLLGMLQPSETLDVFAELGVFLLMVYVGMEVDLDDLFAMGPQALVIAIGAFIIPFALGYASGILTVASVDGALFLGLAMAATSLATKSRILVDLDILDTRIANILLGGALVSDVGVLVAFAGVLGFIQAGTVEIVTLGTILLKAIAFFAITLFIGYRFLPHVWERVESLREQYGFVDKTSVFSIALLVALVFAELAHLAGLHMIIGGFIAGMFLRQADLQEALYEHMHAVIYDLAIGFFAPIFFVTVAFEITLGVFTENLPLLVLLVGIAFVGKIVGSWLFALPTDLSSKEGFVIGFGMNGRGTVEIIIASIGLSNGIIGQGMFSILVFIAVFTTALVPVTVKWGVDWLSQTDELVYTREAADINAD
ncbi:cation:proton antiporter [Halocatena salina]|uniref:Cation:proton antiporter n=1 Tax=Halocatena salina TaxID=2934340 RepID=A0A8U0A279_9EURY|nr:cation:proton antiporter [Halocatena salina]UPM43291.1 cation:proton antiporter [Halocatena salina]